MTTDRSICFTDSADSFGYLINMKILKYVLIMVYFIAELYIIFRMCDEVQKVLGFDWLLLFTQGHIHPSTVIKALMILLTMIQNTNSSSSAAIKFRDGSIGGGWLKGTEPVLKQHVGVMLGKYLIDNNLS